MTPRPPHRRIEGSHGRGVDPVEQLLERPAEPVDLLPVKGCQPPSVILLVVVHSAKGSQPRRCLTDCRYSHSTASLRTWASRPPVAMPATSATPRRGPTDTMNP